MRMKKETQEEVSGICMRSKWKATSKICTRWIWQEVQFRANKSILQGKIGVVQADWSYNDFESYNVYYYDRIYALRKNEIQVIIDSQGRTYISDGTMAIHI